MRAVNETNRRRNLQEAYNKLHGITPKSVQSTVQALLRITNAFSTDPDAGITEEEREELLKNLEDQMLSAAKDLDFEKAAKLRDELFSLRGKKKDVQKPQTRRRKPKRRIHK